MSSPIRVCSILLSTAMWCATLAAADPVLLPIKVTNTATFKEAVGFVDLAGHLAIKPAYASAAGFLEGLAWAEQGGKYGFIDATGKVVIPFIYEDLSSFKAGIARVKLDGKWGLVRPDGTYLKDPTFAYIGEFEEGLAPFQTEKNGPYGFMNAEGKLAIAPSFSGVGPFSEGLAAAAVKGVYGYVDPSGTMVIQAKYGNPSPFRGGLAIVQDQSGSDLVWKIIDKTGVVVKQVDQRIDAGGARFTPFIDGISYWIDAKKLAGTIDTTGTKFPLVLSWNGKPWEPLTKREFVVEKILPGKDGILSISLFTKWVYADAKGNLLADRPFDNVWFFGDSVPGHGKVSIDGKVCWLDRTGKLVWDGRKMTKYDPSTGSLLP